MSKGLVHVYFGDGKGKTTAAAGLAVRAAGCGKKVLVVQLLKGRPSGEVSVLQSLPGVAVVRGKDSGKFSWEMDEAEKQQARRLNDDMVQQAMDEARAGAWDMLVLDEALGACATGLLNEAALLAFLADKPDALEMVLTGRDPSPEMLQASHYATEMRKVKHPYDEGIGARRGIEF